MILIQETSYNPMGAGIYNSLAFDGTYFYLTVTRACEIHKYDLNYNKIETIYTKRVYSNINYDKENDCFYAACCNLNRTYILNCNLFELDYIKSTTINSCTPNFIDLDEGYKLYLSADFSIMGQVIYDDNIYLLANKRGCYSYIVHCKIIKSASTLTCDCNSTDTNISCDKELATNNLLQSIAQIEAAISHILNAEGEKIQSILAHSKNVDDIINVNDSINRSLVNITHIQQILYNKLQLISGK